MVGLFYEAKARVVFGDWDSASGEEVASKYPERVHFLKINVCEYHDILALFATALAKYGRVDHALSNAGVSEQENWFDPNLTVESVQIVSDSPYSYFRYAEKPVKGSGSDYLGCKPSWSPLLCKDCRALFTAWLERKRR